MALFALTILFALLGLEAARAQQDAAPVVVYKLRFDDPAAGSVNLDFFHSAYFVAPQRGGPGTFLFLRDTASGDQHYAEAPQSGRLYTASDGEAETLVIAASTRFDTGFSAYVVTGPKNDTLLLADTELTVARRLSGYAVAADDESGFDGPAEDGTSGVAGTFQISGHLMTGLTLRANRLPAPGVAPTVSFLIELLENQGFTNEGSTEDGTHDNAGPTVDENPDGMPLASPDSPPTADLFP